MFNENTRSMTQLEASFQIKNKSQSISELLTPCPGFEIVGISSTFSIRVIISLPRFKNSLIGRLRVCITVRRRRLTTLGTAATGSSFLLPPQKIFISLNLLSRKTIFETIRTLTAESKVIQMDRTLKKVSLRKLLTIKIQVSQ